MKKISIIVMASIFAFAFYNCAGSEDKQRDNAEASQTDDNHEHIDYDDYEALSLNNGEKWKINEEMRPFVLEGEELLNDFILTGSTDYKNLAANLKEANMNLIRSCTMTGTAHDELHNWLHPYMEELDELEEAETELEAREVIDDLVEAFETFHNYFE